MTSTQLDRSDDAIDAHLRFKWRNLVEPWHGPIADAAAEFSPPSARILDIGCGYGVLTEIVQNRLPDATVDVAEAYQARLDAAKERVPSIDSMFLMDEQDFDVRDRIPGHYDIVILSHVMEHLLRPADGLEDVMTLLKPGGHAIVAVPNPGRPEVLVRNIFRRKKVNKGHVYSWDRSHWINFLEVILGLEVVAYREDTLIPFPGRLGRFLGRRFGRSLVRLFPWLSMSHIAVIRR